MEIIDTSEAAAPGGAFVQGRIVGDVVYTSGQVGVDPASGAVPEDFADEVRQALANLDAVLTAAGSSRGEVIRTMCLLTDVARFAEFNGIYAEFFGAHLPARSTFGVALAGGFRFEIEATALRSAV